MHAARNEGHSEQGHRTERAYPRYDRRVIDLNLRTQQLYVAVTVEVATANRDGSDGPTFSGSGFVIRDNQRFVLVTNRHVLQPNWSPARLPPAPAVIAERVTVRTRGIGGNVNAQSTYSWASAEMREVFHEDGSDVAVAELPGGGDTEQVNWLDRDLLAREAEFDGVTISALDFLAVAGYPKIGAEMSSTPIALPGLLACDPRLRDVHPMVPEGALLFQAFSRSGLSGGPVFAPVRGYKVAGDIEMESSGWRVLRIAGVNGGHLQRHDAEQVGLSYFYPSWMVLRLLD